MSKMKSEFKAGDIEDVEDAMDGDLVGKGPIKSKTKKLKKKKGKSSMDSTLMAYKARGLKGC